MFRLVRVMEPRNVIMLKDIDCTRKENTIKVKLLRLWRMPNRSKVGQFLSIQMVVMDEEGTKMQAQVWHKHFSKHERYLQQDQCYFIENPQIGENQAKFKQLSNENILSFNYDTIIRRCADFAGPINGFDFTSFSALKDGTVNEAFRIDFIGYVTEWFQPEHTKRKDGRPTWKMNLKLMDLEGITLQCTLWEEYCDELQKYISQNKEEVHVVIIVQFGSFNVYKGKVTASNAFDVTKLFINHPIDEIVSFKKRYIEKHCSATSSTHRSIGSCGTSIEDEFLNKFEFRPIGMLSEINKVMGIIVVGTIKAVLTEDEWHYVGCQGCSKKVFPTLVVPDDYDGNEDVELKQVLVCNNPACKPETVSAVPIFRIPIRVQDCSGTATFTLFDREATRLLGMTATQLLEKYIKGEKGATDEKIKPAEFDSLVNKKFGFKVHVGTFNVDQKVDGYAIHKLVDDLTIIAELEKKCISYQGVYSDSMNLAGNDVSSQSETANENSVSVTAENVTPYSNCVESSKKPSAELKRSLNDAFDGESSSSRSSTKSPKNSMNHDAQDGMHQTLLVPKVEKQ